MKGDKTALAFGTVLRELRRKRSLSQEELAFDSDIAPNHVSQLELGQRSPTLKTMLALSRGLKISLVYLVSLVEERLKETTDE